MSNPLEVPSRPVMMQTNRDYRLSSLNGYVVNFKANEPARVPPHVYTEAIRAGAIVVEECEVEATKTDGGQRGAAEAAKLEAEAKAQHVSNACTVILVRDDPSDFKADGYPKLNKVIAEIPPECPKPTAGEVQSAIDELRENIDLADLD
jgi:hypothetical protein